MRCKPFCHFCLLADDKFWLSPLFTNRKINIGTDMGGKSVQTFFFLVFSYCNLFFQMSTNMKQRWETILPKKNSAHIPEPTMGIQVHIPGLINQSNYRIIPNPNQSLYYAPAGRYDSADLGRIIIRVRLFQIFHSSRIRYQCVLFHSSVAYIMIWQKIIHVYSCNSVERPSEPFHNWKQFQPL